MKKAVVLVLVLVVCLSLCACDGGNDAPETQVPTTIETTTVQTEQTEPKTTEDAVVEMAEDAISYLKEQLVFPESFELTSVSYVKKIDEVVFKIVFSAKNSYGGEIDTAAYFEYDENKKTFSDLYQSGIKLAESRAKEKLLKDFEYFIKYGTDRTQTDKSSIYNEDAYFLEESESSEGSYKIWKDFEEDIDIRLFG